MGSGLRGLRSPEPIYDLRFTIYDLRFGRERAWRRGGAELVRCGILIAGCGRG